METMCQGRPRERGSTKKRTDEALGGKRKLQKKPNHGGGIDGNSDWGELALKRRKRQQDAKRGGGEDGPQQLLKRWAIYQGGPSRNKKGPCGDAGGEKHWYQRRALLALT